MAINPIQPMNTLPFAGEVQDAAEPKRDGAVFAKVVKQFLDDVNTDQLRAENKVELLATGQTDDINSVMLALAQADLTFRMAMEVRNKMVDAYQEVSRMQL